jgi:hypothetical protein
MKFRGDLDAFIKISFIGWFRFSFVVLHVKLIDPKIFLMHTYMCVLFGMPSYSK